MNLPLPERGWKKFRSAFDWIIPTLGPQVKPNQTQIWNNPPAITANKGGGFDLKIPTGGQQFTLHRLDAPAAVAISYRGKSFAFFFEALVGLLAFGGGIYLLWRAVTWRLAYFAAAGILPLIIAGAVSPTAASFWSAIYLGTFFGAIAWILQGMPGLLKRWLQRFRDCFGRFRAKRAAKKEAKRAAKDKKKSVKATDTDAKG